MGVFDVQKEIDARYRQLRKDVVSGKMSFLAAKGRLQMRATIAIKKEEQRVEALMARCLARDRSEF